MADQKISQLTVKATFAAADEWVIVDSATATNKKVTGFDQKVGTSNSVSFAGITDSTLTTVNGIVTTNGSGTFSSSVTLPDGTLATTQVMADNSTKLATTAYVHAFLPVTEANGGTGETTYLDGQVLIGNTGTGGLDKANLTGTGNRISIINSAGGIRLQTPQDIASISTPIFSGLMMTSTTKGCVFPRMSTAQRLALAPFDGTIVYDLNLFKFQKLENGTWQTLEGTELFEDLTDVTGAYTTANALYKTDAAVTGLEETTTLLTEPMANQFTFTRGTTAVTVQADLTVEATSLINQDLTTDATPTFNGATLTSTTDPLIVPRMTTTQKNALTGINGMIVYDSTLNKFQGFENGIWTSFI